MSISNLFTDLSKPWQNLNVNGLVADNQVVIPKVDVLPLPNKGEIVSLNTSPTTAELYYSDGISWYQVSKQFNDSSIYSGISDGTLITATTAEMSLLPLTSVGSLTLLANTFKPGDAYHMVIAGNFGSQNANTLTLRWKTNGVTGTSEIIPLVGTSGEHFEIEIDWVIRKIGGAGVAEIATNWDFTYSDSGAGQFRGDRITSINNTTFDTTINNTLSLTVQFSTNNANNTIQSKMAYLKRMNQF